MTAREAYQILKSKFPSMEITSCNEYDTVFVFQLAPATVKNPSRLLTGLTSVDKKTGEVKTFKPYDIPFEEYENGKEVVATVYGGE